MKHLDLSIVKDNKIIKSILKERNSELSFNSLKILSFKITLTNLRIVTDKWFFLKKDNFIDPKIFKNLKLNYKQNKTMFNITF